MNRKCRFCNRVFDKLNALTYHVYNCKTRLRINRRKVFHRKIKKHENIYANIYNIVRLFNENNRM